MTETSADRVVVIGAGIGGLTAAALLAQSGYAVTVLEQSSVVGGFIQTSLFLTGLPVMAAFRTG